MKKFACLLSGCILLVCGCTVRTYSVTRDRLDQELASGNRGYLQGQAPETQGPRKETRTTQIVEVEIGSPLKFEKGKGLKPLEEPATASSIQQEGDDAGRVFETVLPEQPQDKELEKYTVQKGDTLQKISKKYFGTTKNWHKIYQANKEVLKGPDKVYPGQIISIPNLPKIEQPAVKEAGENLK